MTAKKKRTRAPAPPVRAGRSPEAQRTIDRLTADYARENSRAAELTLKVVDLENALAAANRSAASGARPMVLVQDEVLSKETRHAQEQLAQRTGERDELRIMLLAVQKDLVRVAMHVGSIWKDD